MVGSRRILLRRLLSHPSGALHPNPLFLDAGGLVSASPASPACVPSRMLFCCSILGFYVLKRVTSQSKVVSTAACAPSTMAGRWPGAHLDATRVERGRIDVRAGHWRQGVGQSRDTRGLQIIRAAHPIGSRRHRTSWPSKEWNRAATRFPTGPEIRAGSGYEKRN